MLTLNNPRDSFSPTGYGPVYWTWWIGDTSGPERPYIDESQLKRDSHVMWMRKRIDRANTE